MLSHIIVGVALVIFDLLFWTRAFAVIANFTLNIFLICFGRRRACCFACGAYTVISMTSLGTSGISFADAQPNDLWYCAKCESMNSLKTGTIVEHRCKVLGYCPICNEKKAKSVFNSSPKQHLQKSHGRNNGFCTTCLHNQQIFISALANDPPRGMDFETFKRKLLSRHPITCNSCEIMARQRIEKVNSKFKKNVLFDRLMASKQKSHDNIKYPLYTYICALVTWIASFANSSSQIASITTRASLIFYQIVQLAINHHWLVDYLKMAGLPFILGPSIQSDAVVGNALCKIKWNPPLDSTSFDCLIYHLVYYSLPILIALSLLCGLFYQHKWIKNNPAPIYTTTFHTATVIVFNHFNESPHMYYIPLLCLLWHFSSFIREHDVLGDAGLISLHFDRSKTKIKTKTEPTIIDEPPASCVEDEIFSLSLE